MMASWGPSRCQGIRDGRVAGYSWSFESQGGLFIPVFGFGSGMEAVKLFGRTVSVVDGSGCLSPCG